MNAKLNPINSVKVTLGVSAIVLVIVTTGFHKNEPSATYTPPIYTAKQSPDVVAVQTAVITSKSTGKATVKLDDFVLQVSFDYEAHPDNYGVQGSEFTAVDITQLSVDDIHDINGNAYRDFTNFNDIVQIKELVRGHLERNQMVEVA